MVQTQCFFSSVGASSCSSFADLDCICSSKEFYHEAQQCVFKDCSVEQGLSKTR